MDTTRYNRVKGAQAIRRLITKSFDNAKDGTIVYGICNLDLVKAHFPEAELISVDPGREAADIPSKFIYTSLNGPELRASDRINNRESRYINEDFSINFSVVGTAVILVTVEEEQPVGYYVDSEGLAADMRSLFEIVWNRTET